VNQQDKLNQQWYDEALSAMASYAPFQNLSKDDQHSCAIEIMLIVSSAVAVQLFYRLQNKPIPQVSKGSDENFQRTLVSDFADELEYNNRSHLPQIKTLNEKSGRFELFNDPRYTAMRTIDFHPLHKPCINPVTVVHIQQWIQEFYLPDQTIFNFGTNNCNRTISRVELEIIAREYSASRKCEF